MIFNKRNTLAPLLFSSVLLLAACGDDEQVTEPVNNDGQEQPTDSEGTENTSPEASETFGFTEFEVNADFPDMDDMIEINYEEDRDEIEAEYKNKMTETDLSGNDAMDEIEPGLSQLELTPDTADDDAIAQVIAAFGIEDDFTEIEIEVKYPDGTEKEYKQTRN
ncbi:YusW family protein [Planococcus sp. ISL-110]|uniref:YusW family protein n=1 Tax=Planococcus sp. ISL-110 TaxID=2819167 RepID=UPI001BEA1671|nr:YusW family protein [Planococcus sp. ISL-110]MBT2569292.1 hypothetical protein [Planococcus sp. ISL-110]